MFNTRTLSRWCLVWLLLSAGTVRSAEVNVDAIVHEVNAKKVTVIFGELERCKQTAVRMIGIMATQHPGASEIEWVRIRARLDYDNVEAAIAKHYAANFTVDELKHLVAFFDPPAMRRLIVSVRMMALNPPTPENMAGEMERLKKEHGTEVFLKFATLMNSALGRQLSATMRTSEEVCRTELVAALTEATIKSRSRR